MTAGELLREARLQHGLSQAQLARRAATSQAAISRIERDQVSPTVETLRVLLDKLGEELRLRARTVDYGHDRTLLRANLNRSAKERIEYAVAAARAVEPIRELARRR